MKKNVLTIALLSAIGLSQAVADTDTSPDFNSIGFDKSREVSGAKNQNTSRNPGSINGGVTISSTTGSVSTSEEEVIRSADLSSECTTGQVAVDSSGKLVSCQSGRWKAGGGELELDGASALWAAHEGQVISCTTIEKGREFVIKARVLNGKPQYMITGDATWKNGYYHNAQSVGRDRPFVELEITVGGGIDAALTYPSLYTNVHDQSCRASWR